MKFAVSLAFVLGLAALAGAQTQAPEITISGSQSMKDGVRILRDVTFDIDGVLITADTAENQDGGMVLQNAKVMLPKSGTVRMRVKFPQQ
jgi:hypothetical protein